MKGRGTSYEGKTPAHVTPERGGKRVALVIGNGRYAHAAPLDNPTRDAEAMAAVLARLGFDVVMGLDLDLRRIGDVQGAFEDNLRVRPDVALLFYAGHGLQVDGRNYLIPVDAEITQKAHLASRALLFNDVLDGMAQQAGASLVFLDACRDNPFTRNLARSLGDSARYAGVRGGLARIEKVAGTFIAYATAPDQVAFDGKGTNSPFTAALLQHIETPGLSVGDLMIDVRNKVLAETSGRQEPWDQSSLRARFYFVPSEPEPPRPVSEAAGEWVAIQGTTSLATLALFIERHAGTPWAEYARARIDELRLLDQQRQEAEAARKKASASTILKDILANLPLRWIGGGVALTALAAVLIWRPWEGAPLPTADGKAVVADVAPVAAEAPSPWLGGLELQIKGSPTGQRAQGPREVVDLSTPAPMPPTGQLTADQYEEMLLSTLTSASQPTSGAAPSKEGPSATANAEPPRQRGMRLLDVDLSCKDTWVRVGGDERCLKPGDTFQDCFTTQGKRVCGPKMVVVPAGKFLMGSPDDEKERWTDEGPQHVVTIAKPFAVGITHVTRGEFAAFVAASGHKIDGGCFMRPYDGVGSKLDAKASWRAPGFDQDDTHPVVCVNWHDAQGYVTWLRKGAGAEYRLLTEAEAEYVARGTTAATRKPRYFFGDDSKDLCTYGNGPDLTTKTKFPEWSLSELGEGGVIAGPGRRVIPGAILGCKDGYVYTAPGGHFVANAFGVKDVHGNAWSWTQDCYEAGTMGGDYHGAPKDGTKAVEMKGCKDRAARGGSWRSHDGLLRAARRSSFGREERHDDLGFRVGRVLAALAPTPSAAPAGTLAPTTTAPAPAPIPAPKAP